MQDIRNQLNIKTIRWKVEGRTLKRIGHVMRMDDKRLTKAACLGWLNDLQTLPKCPGKRQNTSLLAEAHQRSGNGCERDRQTDSGQKRMEASGESTNGAPA